MLVGLNVLAWLLITVTGGENSPWVDRLALRPLGACTSIADPGSIYSNLGVQHCEVIGRWFPGVADGAPWQLLTSVFTHYDHVHLAMNMLVLVLLGPSVETHLSRTAYLVVYLLSGLAGSTLVYWLVEPQTLTLGASGAVFGLFGCLLVLAVRGGGDVRATIILIAINVGYTFIGDNISWQGHIGGLVVGLTSSWLLTSRNRRRRWPGVIGLAVALVVALAVRTTQLGGF